MLALVTLDGETLSVKFRLIGAFTPSSPAGQATSARLTVGCVGSLSHDAAATHTSVAAIRVAVRLKATDIARSRDRVIEARRRGGIATRSRPRTALACGALGWSERAAGGHQQFLLRIDVHF